MRKTDESIADINSYNGKAKCIPISKLNIYKKLDKVYIKLDEFGYISCDKEGTELLFTNLSIRTGTKSNIITTNLSFDRWDEIFIDPVMTAAITDRLTHKSFVINMSGNSYRLKKTKDWLKTLSNN